MRKFNFISPGTKNIDKIIAGFSKCGKYSKEFIKDLKEGLKNSSYFNKNNR